MNTTTMQLPCVDFAAVRGVPPADQLEPANVRRRYAQAVACALLGEPSWEITTWDWGACPVFLRERAAAEDWPVISMARFNVAITMMMRPVPLPSDPDDLITRAVATLDADLQPLAYRTLDALWQGDYPTEDLSPLAEPFGGAILEAGRAGHRACEAVFAEALRASA